MNLDRCSGVLLHPTSLPGRYGVGTFGDEAYENLMKAAERQKGQKKEAAI